MFGMNKQTMYVISNVGSTVINMDVLKQEMIDKNEMYSVKFVAREGESSKQTDARIKLWLKHRNDNYVKHIDDSYIKPTFKTRGEAKLESAKQNDVIVAEVRIPVKKTFWQRVFA